MAQENNPNVEPGWPDGYLEFTYNLLVSAMMARICARQGTDIREDMMDCEKDAHVRLGNMLAELRNRDLGFPLSRE